MLAAGEMMLGDAGVDEMGGGRVNGRRGESRWLWGGRGEGVGIRAERVARDF